jgi:hypothetical protein
VASHYTNTMLVDGFGDTLAHTVKLYAVNTGEAVSAPVSVTVTPLTPGYILARRSLQIQGTFGGFDLTCNNPVEDNLAIIPMVDTLNNGKWEQTTGMENTYSNLSVIQASVRNQPAVTRNFAFVVRDRWLHYSDTLVVKLTPLFEQPLDKTKWTNFVLPNDATILNNGGLTNVSYIWDQNLHPGWPQCLFTVESATSSQTVTIDLGSAHILSRMQVNPYQENGGFYYVRGNVKDFEIWGSNAPNLSNPEPDILSDPTWTKLTTCHVIKPSGSAYQTETTDDKNQAYNGWQFNFPTGLAAYRYLRIRSLSNWQGSYFINIAEFTLWGN